MGSIGEDWIEKIAIEQGFRIQPLPGSDKILIKENIAIVVEEKDWKDAVKVYKNNIYQRGINGKFYRHNKGQVMGYVEEMKKQNEEKGMFFHIIPVYAFSNLQGRRVQLVQFGKFSTIFVVHKEYFSQWLKYAERVYIGEATLSNQSMYMGGK